MNLNRLKLKFTPPLLLFSFLLFVLFLPISLNINFIQNDEWVYYPTVQNFLNLDFKLHWYIGTTFYSQGLLAALFSKLFSLSKTPVLTLLISIANFYIFSKILLKFFNLNTFKSVVLSLVLFFNPLYFYSSFGFMTENYLLFYTLLSLYFFLDYKESKRGKSLILSAVFALLSFFVRQVGILLPLSYIVYFALNKKFRESFLFVLLSFGLIGYYFTFFPRTEIMMQNSFNFTNLTNFRQNYNFILKVLIYLSAFFLPLTYLYSEYVYKSYSKLKLLFFSFLSIAIAVYLYFKFNSSLFPYFFNIFERPGFFQGSLDGGKYHFRGFFDLYRLWELFAIIGVGTLISYIVFFRKKLINIYSIYILMSLTLFLVLPYFYDRYLVSLIPFFILFVVNQVDLSKIGLFKTGAFALFLAVFSIYMTLDYVGWQKYVWNKSVQLSEQEEVDKNNIYATHAWRRMYNVNDSREGVKYEFSFDSEREDSDYKMVEAYDNNIPLNIFIEPKVYLYERTD